MFYKGSPEDYAAKSLMGAIPRCGHELCSPTFLEQDGVVEETEVFYVTLEMSPGLDPRVKLRNFIHRAEVYIIDNDCKKCFAMSALPPIKLFVTIGANVSLGYYDYVISESSSILEVCIIIFAESSECSVEYDFTVSLLTLFSGNVNL